jgi:hypothetical protein
MHKLAKLYFAILISIYCSVVPASGANIIDQIEIMLDAAHGDALEVFYLDLTLYYVSCASGFRLADAKRGALEAGLKADETTTRNQTVQCQTDKLTLGNAHIAEIRATLPKPEAQAALKDLALYWRLRMSEVNIWHSEAEDFVLLRNLKAHTERIRLESEW